MITAFAILCVLVLVIVLASRTPSTAQDARDVLRGGVKRQLKQ